MKKGLFTFLITILSAFTFFTPKIYAAGEFSTNSNIIYDIGQDGITTVTENIVIENLTDRYYPSSFSLTIGATNISDISAFDANGPLNIKSSKVDNRSKIDVEFKDEVVGKGKKYNWTLKFRSGDFAEKQGKIWQISIPKITPSTDNEDFRLTLSIPENFGDFSYISPQPQSQVESGGKIHFYYTKEILKESGIIANFGTKQVYEFNLTYNLKNNSFLPTIYNLVLPPDTSYQQVLINSITPKPDNVNIDKDGNYIAQITVDRRKSLTVTVSGIAKLSTDSLLIDKNLLSEDRERLLLTQKYWEKDNPLIKSTLDKILEGKANATNQEKVKLIYKYVVKTLKYDQLRLENNDFTRFGAVTAINNPERSLCNEFSDLFIALSRAADIPSRNLVGYAYTSNQALRPLSYQKDVLHAWPEYYDLEKGWIMVDPTWENTTSGIDYFTKNDLNHFVFYIETDPERPLVIADKADVHFTDKDFKGGSDAQVELFLADQLYAGFPAKLKIKIENKGNQSYPSSNFLLKSNKIKIEGNKNFTMPVIPPFGYLNYEYNLYTNTLWDSFDDNITMKIGNKPIEQKVLVKPFVSYRYFSPIIMGIIFIMVLIYSLVLYWNLKHPKVVKKVIQIEKK